MIGSQVGRRGSPQGAHRRLVENGTGPGADAIGTESQYLS
jgi:hypothetical protein